MARPGAKRLRIRGTVRLQQPLHIGGMPDGVDTDMPLACDGQGELYLPGTSLAGPLRAWVEDSFGNEGEALARQMFGFQKPPRSDDDRVDGFASYVIVEDAHVKLPKEHSPEIWDGVGVDREWGTAAEAVKFDRAVLPRGSEFELNLVVEIPPELDEGTGPSEMRAVVGHLVKALCDGQVGFGAARTRGLGQVQLDIETLKIVEEDWSSREGILQLLRGRKSINASDASTLDEWISGAGGLRSTRPLTVEVTIDWSPRGPLMVKAAHDGLAVDMLPMMSARGDNQVAMVLPGSSLKGALRSQAERILRTLLEIDPQDPQCGWRKARKRQRHLQQIQVPLVETLFGSAKRKTESENLGRARKGVLSVASCYAQSPAFTADQWRTIAGAPTAESVPEGKQSSLYQALEQANAFDAVGEQPYFRQGYHVAVDRWTGGAAESFLYSSIEPFQVQWEPIRLSLQLGRVVPEERPALVALLLLVLRDLAEQRIPIGFGVNRGYGDVCVQEVQFDVRGGGYEALDWLCWPLAELPFDRLKELESAWNEWINKARTTRGLAP